MRTQEIQPSRVSRAINQKIGGIAAVVLAFIGICFLVYNWEGYRYYPDHHSAEITLVKWTWWGIHTTEKKMRFQHGQWYSRDLTGQTWTPVYFEQSGL